jgi:hypothetical protein
VLNVKKNHMECKINTIRNIIGQLLLVVKFPPHVIHSKSLKQSTLLILHLPPSNN